MVSENPFAEFRSECEKCLAQALQKALPEVRVSNLAFEKPPNVDYGQLASSICFELARKVEMKPIGLAERLIKSMDTANLTLVDHVVSAGGGYINFHANFTKLAELIMASTSKLDSHYGFVQVRKPLKVIVEHTSVNPLHPIHIGQARNPVLGDCLARILKARGHHVFRHYYIDDVGRQSAVIAYGYDKLGRPKPEGKPDTFVGRIYTITSCIVEIRRLKDELDRAKAISADEEAAKLTRELDEWVAVAADLQSRYSELFDRLLKSIEKDADPEGAMGSLNREYEDGKPEAKRLVREVSEMCLGGFRQSLGRIDVSYDSWDWESELVVWSGRAHEVLEGLKQTGFTHTEKGVVEFDADRAIQRLNLRGRLGLREDYQITPLTLVRADGTTLYTTRDLAYTLWKFERAARTINVIGMEQTLAQLQLKIAMYALGFAQFADNLIHFAYNLVTLPGYKMSSRRGRYVSFDEVMDEAEKRAFEEVSKRSPQLPEEEKRRIANFVGLGAVRYALLETDASKPVVFTWERVLNFERNSAPYIQYTHARANSILRKAARKPEKPDYALLREKLEREILLLLSEFPEVFHDAADYMKPNLIADYANGLADKFNTFYNALPVIKAESWGLSDARLGLTDSVRIVLRNALNLIGIVAPEKM